MSNGTYYANIDITATSGNGSENYPFNFNNLKSFIDSSSGTYDWNNNLVKIENYDIVNIKGTYSGTDVHLFSVISDFGADMALLKSWDEKLYGPWKIIDSNSANSIIIVPNTTAFLATPGTLYIDGLCIKKPNMSMNEGTPDSNMQAIFTNCIFYGDIRYNNDTSAAGYYYYDYFMGCTFIDTYFYGIDYPSDSPSNVAFVDCVFYNSLFDLTDKTSGVNNGIYYYENCYFNSTSSTVFSATNLTYDTISLSSCTFSWSCLSTFPELSAISTNSKSDLKYENFGLPNRTFNRRLKYYMYDQINGTKYSPPLNIVNSRGYYNYSQGKYGSPRVGIGAFYFTDYYAYVDFGDISTSGHVGTSVDPFSYIDFWNFVGQNPIVDINDTFESSSFNTLWNSSFKSNYVIQNINGDYCAVKSTSSTASLDLIGSSFIVEYGVRFGPTNLSNSNVEVSAKTEYGGVCIISLKWVDDNIVCNFNGTITNISWPYSNATLLKLKIERNGHYYSGYYYNNSTWIKITEGYFYTTENIILDVPNNIVNSHGFSYINLRKSEINTTSFKVVNGDVFKIKGEVDITSLPGGNKFFVDKQYDLLAWDTSAYGPWRIYDEGNIVSLGGYILENGIIYTSGSNNIDLILYPKRMDNLFIKGKKISLRDYTFCRRNEDDISNYCALSFSANVNYDDIYVRGCTIICQDNDVFNNLDFDFRSKKRIVMKDSVVYINKFEPLAGISSPYTSAISANIDNVVTNVSDSNTLKNTFNYNSYTEKECQYNWSVPLNWPDWDNSKYIFAYSRLGSGITLSGTGAW